MWISESRSTSPARIRRAYLAGVLGGIVGARLWFALQYGNFSLVGGWASWGFVIGASVLSVLWLRWETGSAAFGEFADAVAPALALGGAFMRIACFVVGCNFGKPTDLPWAVTYAPGDPAFLKQLMAGLIPASARSALPVHPTQLYESMALLAVAIFLFKAPVSLFRWSRKPGDLFFAGIACYSVFRFLVEFLRDDAGGVAFGPLTFAQATSLLLLLTVLSLFFVTRRLRHQQLPDNAPAFHLPEPPGVKV